MWEEELKKKSWCILCGEKCEDEANHQDIIVVTVRDTITDIHSLLKQQREICAEIYLKKSEYDYYKAQSDQIAICIGRDKILNAPEPEVK